MGDCKLRSAVEAALEHLESMGCDESTYDYLNDYFGREEGGDCAYVRLHKQLKDALQVEREATCEKSSQVGNNAKCREALEAVIKVGYPHNFQREAPHIRGYCYDITKAIEKCYAALTEPPRNCDLPTVIANPHGAWLKDCDNWDDFGSPEKEIHDWLLAKAKGESK